MLIRSFVCPACGAARESLEGAVVLVCTYCSVVVSVDTHEYWRGDELAALAADGIRAMVRPTAMEARKTSLGAEMFHAGAAGERARWRAAAEELYSVVAVSDPSLLSGVAPGEWVRRTVAFAEVLEFDAAMKSLQHGFGGVCGQILGAPDPVSAARAALENGRAYARAIDAHPDLGPRMLPQGVEAYARMILRSSIACYASLLADGVAKRIYVEVLGDEETKTGSRARCSRCGADLARVEGEGLVKCQHCHAVVDVSVDDPWLTSTLAVWKLAEQDVLRRGKLDTHEPVLAAVGCFLHAKGEVSADAAVGFLRRAIPWMPRERLHAGLLLLAGSTDPRRASLLHAVREQTETWEHDASLEPHYERPPAPPPATRAEVDAWIETTLAHYGYVAGTTERDPKAQVETLLGFCTSALQVAEVHHTAAAVTPEGALDFFRRAAPDFDRERMGEHVRVMTGCYAGVGEMGGVHAFLVGLGELLQGGDR